MNNINAIFLFLFLCAALTVQCRKDECETITCQNGGTCIEGACNCPTGFTGDHCETLINNNPNDTIYFVVDGIKVSKGVITAKTTTSVTISGDFQVLSNIYPITDYGFVYSSTSQIPTLNDSFVSKGPQTGIGPYTVVINNLIPNTTYRARLFLKSNDLVTYLDPTAVLIFTTLSIQVPILLTSNANNVTLNSAIVTSSLSSLGSYAQFSGFGHCWDTLQNPKLEGNPNIDFKGSISSDTIFTSSLSNLLANKSYFVRAYVTNGDTTFYGNQIQFSTLNYTAPLIILNPVVGQTYNSAPFNVSIASLGSFTSLIDRGIVWSTVSPPVLGANLAQEIHVGATSSAGSFNGTITNLTPATTYYTRAFVSTPTGQIYYGNQITFATPNIVLPAIVLNPITGQTYNSAPYNGQITTLGNFSSLLDYGIVWGTTDNPELGVNLAQETHLGATSSAGSFNGTITNLTPATTYYARAFVSTPTGQTYYGNQIAFATPNIVLPSIVLNPITGQNYNSAPYSGALTSLGNFTSLFDYGIVWGTTDSPELGVNLAQETHLGATSSTGSFSGTITNLSPVTTYYARAFVSATTGQTYYGNQITFATPNIVLPAIVLNPITGQTINSAPYSGTITTLGNFSSLFDYGIVWATTDNPELGANLAQEIHSGPIASAGTFSGTIPNLSANTTYQVRPFAITNTGSTYYGNQVTFSTPAILQPTITLGPITNFSYTTAQATPNITSLGDFTTLFDHGIVWSTELNPTLGTNPDQEVHNFAVNSTGIFTANLTNLQYATLYHVRAFVKTTAGANPIYSSDVTFTTLAPTPPTINGVTVSNVTNTGASLASSMPVIGSFPISNYGFCWGVTSNPIVPLNPNIYSLGSASSPVPSFSSNLTGLQENTTYYVRAFATPDGVNYYYSIQNTFTTPLSLPTLASVTSSSITTSSLTAQSAITSIGLSNVFEYGFCYSSVYAVPNLTNSASVPVYATQTGPVSFSQPITGLTPNTTYYICAYAKNSYGTAYSNVHTAATIAIVTASVTTVSTSNIGNNVATFTGNITNLGNVPIVEHGFCYAYKNVPTIDSTKLDLGPTSSTGNFETTAIGLKAGTNYIVRAYTLDALSNVKYGGALFATTTETGLVLYYPFNGNYTDASGNGYDGETTAVPTLTSGHNGVANTAYDFDGINDFIQCSDANVGNFSLSGNFSQCIWFNTHSSNFTSGLHYVYRKRSSYSCADGIVIYINNDSSPTMYLEHINCGTTVNTFYVGNQAELVNQWVFVCYIKENGVSFVYINGLLSENYSDNADNIVNLPFRLGADNTAYEDYFKGRIDEVRFYNYALTASQIADVYNR